MTGPPAPGPAPARSWPSATRTCRSPLRRGSGQPRRLRSRSPSSRSPGPTRSLPRTAPSAGCASTPATRPSRPGRRRATTSGRARRPGHRRGARRGRRCAWSAAPAAARSTSTSRRRPRAASRSSNTPGKNAEAVAELTIAFALMLIRGRAAGQPLSRRRRQARGLHLRGPGVLRPRGAEPTLGLVGLGHVGREVATGRGASASPSSRFDPRAARRRQPGRRRPGQLRRPAGRVRPRLGARQGDGGEPAPVRRQGVRQHETGLGFINTARESLVDESALAEAITRGSSPVPRSTWSKPPPTSAGTRCSTCPRSSSPRISAAPPKRR